MEKPYIEKTIKVGNPAYPKDARCGNSGCGHEYERHFDGYGLEPWDMSAGCKYCDCMEFTEVIVKQGDTICHKSNPLGIKSSWSFKVLGVSTKHDQIWIESDPKKHPSEKPTLRSYKDVATQIRKGDWIVI